MNNKKKLYINFLNKIRFVKYFPNFLPERMAGWCWGPACSKHCLCFTILKQILLWQARAQEFTMTVKCQAMEMAPPPPITPYALTQPVTSQGPVIITKFPKLLALTSFFFLTIAGVTGCLHSVSTVINILSHWNAPMTLLCGHFSFCFSPRWQMTACLVSSPGDFNEL